MLFDYGDEITMTVEHLEDCVDAGLLVLSVELVIRFLCMKVNHWLKS